MRSTHKICLRIGAGVLVLFYSALALLPGMVLALFLLLISPVLPKALMAASFFAGWKDRQVFVITGDADSRTPISSIRPKVLQMVKSGVSAELEIVPGVDHFLFFSHRERVPKSIAEAVGGG